MRNYWERRRTTNPGYLVCFGRAQALLHSKQYLTNWITVSACLERLGYRPFARTSVKARFATYSVMMLIRDSGPLIPRNTPLLSRRVTIPRANGKWNYNSSYTLKNLAWLYLTN